MSVRKVNSDGVKIHDSVQVKLKTAGTTQVIQFTAGDNKSCQFVIFPEAIMYSENGKYVILF